MATRRKKKRKNQGKSQKGSETICQAFLLGDDKVNAEGFERILEQSRQAVSPAPLIRRVSYLRLP